MNFLKYIIIFILSCAGLTSCYKEFLNKKPSSDIIEPTTLNDFIGMLDYSDVVNQTAGLPQLACDEYYFLDKVGWEAAQTATERNSYIWAKDVFGGEVNKDDWNIPYQQIFIANSVLEGLINKTFQDSIGTSQYDFVKGWAYFVRAYALYDLVKNFATAYDSSTSANDLGVPLKLKDEIDDIESRSTVQETYDQILSDAKKSVSLLPTPLPVGHLNRPSKEAAYGLLARIYLSMRIYKLAGAYADSSLQLDNHLVDYNTIDTTSTRPFQKDNLEIIYNSNQVVDYSGETTPYSQNISIDSNLINSFHDNDLRLAIYFTEYEPGHYTIKNGYTGYGLYPFTGIATDELYLIRSEAYAREGDTSNALKDLNTLLVKRYKTGTFIPIAANSTSEVLNDILMERRKELVYRGLRWSDLKRLNKEGANIMLKRNLDGTIYTLPPNDPRYIFNIPEDEIDLSGIKQNPR